MSGLRLLGALVLVCICSLSGVERAEAQACPVGVEAHSPVTALEEGRLGTPRRACARTELALALGGSAVVDTEGFFGWVRVSGRLQGSYALSADTELFADIELLRFETVISSVSADYLGLGFTSVGVSHRVLESSTLALALRGRLVLPAIGYTALQWPFAIDVGADLTARLAALVTVGASLSALGSLGVGPGPADPRAGLTLHGFATLTPDRSWALSLGIFSQLLLLDPLDALGLAASARLSLGRVQIGLHVSAPFFGSKRTLASGVLRVSYAFDRPAEGEVVAQRIAGTP